MIDWYQFVLAAKVQHQNPVLAFLTYDDEHHRVAFLNLDAVIPAQALESAPMIKQGLVGVDHLAYTYASINDLFENFRQLEARGIKPYWCIHHGITVSMYYADPDGNQMEFQVDCFSDSVEANAFLCGPHFAENPTGVEFDPHEWMARVRAGAVLSDFIARTVHLPVSPVRGSAVAPA
jgi:hypothetical protein